MTDQSFIKEIKRVVFLCCGFFGSVAILLVIFLLIVNSEDDTSLVYSDSGISLHPDNIYAMNYDVSTLNDSEANRIIKYGYELFINTPKYIGPDNPITEMVYAGNSLSCNNCHLDAGTKPFSAPLIGIIQRFPQFRGRENKIGSIEERIDGCMERSMNGRKMPVESEEMKAMVSYLNWLSRYSPKDGNIEGKGFLKIKIPDRAVNLTKGAAIFRNKCSECHGFDGQGVKVKDSAGYTYPPLWGDMSFNNGAGMTRVITAAQFIKGNMPFGTTFLAPQLTDEEAYDVAGYISQQVRPIKKNSELDFPDINKKPVSTPYPPYNDPFSMEQHQLGPFLEIIDYYWNTYQIKKTK
jgi:thiosulfate dehydrogenase